jgi:hypothetical protein
MFGVSLLFATLFFHFGKLFGFAALGIIGFAVFRLAYCSPGLTGLALFCAATPVFLAGVLLANPGRRFPYILEALGCILLTASFGLLFPSDRVPLVLSLPCGFCLGIATWLLCALATRARLNKLSDL